MSDNNIKITIQYDVESIVKCLHPYWDKIGAGLVAKEDYVPQPDFTWYKVEVDGELAGYFSSDLYSHQAASIHVSILDKYRPLKEEIVREWKRVLFREIPSSVEHLIGFIPKNNSESILFALENGWNLVEVVKEAGMKIFIMGISVEDFKNQEEKV